MPSGSSFEYSGEGKIISIIGHQKFASKNRGDLATHALSILDVEPFKSLHGRSRY